MIRSQVVLRLFTAIFAFLSAAAIAQVPENTYQDLHWRMIGPFRGGRTRAAAGVPSQPNVFYIGFDNGGVWRSTDFGSTWTPLFDGQTTGSIGAIAVAAGLVGAAAPAWVASRKDPIEALAHE